MDQGDSTLTTPASSGAFWDPNKNILAQPGIPDKSVLLSLGHVGPGPHGILGFVVLHRSRNDDLRTLLNVAMNEMMIISNTRES